MVWPSPWSPPLEWCRKTRPSQVAKARPLRNFSIDGAKVVIAIAQTGLIFGILWSRRMISFVLLQQRHDDRFFDLWQILSEAKPSCVNNTPAKRFRWCDASIIIFEMGLTVWRELPIYGSTGSRHPFKSALRPRGRRVCRRSIVRRPTFVDSSNT